MVSIKGHGAYRMRSITSNLGQTTIDLKFQTSNKTLEIKQKI